MRGAPIPRALAYLRAREGRDGGFELSPGARLGRAVDGVGDPGVPRRRREAAGGRVRLPRADARADGSLRYSAKYATTPVWVTAQVLPALARKPFPLR